MVWQGRDIVLRWTKELSQRLGRPENEIAGGLSAHAFSPSNRVEIRFSDKSFANFRYAFAIISPERSLVAVFTEHCGYYEFALSPEMNITQIREDVYCHEAAQ